MDTDTYAPGETLQATVFIRPYKELPQRIRVSLKLPADLPEGSYTAKLVDAGITRIAQKLGEEGLELALAAVAQSDREVIGEAADLLFHTALLLKVKGLSLAQVVAELESRHRGREAPATRA